MPVQLQPLDRALKLDRDQNGIELSSINNNTIALQASGASEFVEKSRLLRVPRVTPRAIGRWWSLYVDPDLICQHDGQTVHDPRDFLALERTHLAYIRTGNALSLFGVVLAQLFILKSADVTHGRTLAVCAYVLAILLSILSAVRMIWVQNKIINGHIDTSALLCVFTSCLLLALLVALLIINQMD